LQKDFLKKEISSTGFMVWFLSGLIFGIADNIAVCFSNPGFFSIGERGLLMASSIGGFIIISLLAGLLATLFLMFLSYLPFWRRYYTKNHIVVMQMSLSFSFFLLIIAFIVDQRHWKEMLALDPKTISYNLLFLFIYISLIYSFYRLIQWIKDNGKRFSIFAGLQFFMALFGVISVYTIKLYNRKKPDIYSNLRIFIFLTASAFLSILLYYLLKRVLKNFQTQRSFNKLIGVGIILSVIFIITTFIYAVYNIPQGYVVFFSPSSKAQPHKRINCLFILIDDLRFDHLSCNGYYRKTSPHIDALAAKGILFRQAIASSSHTSRSVPSIFTSLFPLAHEASASSQEFYSLSPKHNTLTSILARNGYITAGFVANNPFIKLSGISRDFDTYYDGNLFMKIPHYSLFYEKIARKFLNRDVRAENLNHQAMRWLKKNHQYPFFLYIHYMDVHYPRIPYKRHIDRLEQESKLDISKLKRYPFEKGENVEKLYSIISRYDGDISYLDEHIGKLLAYLDALHLDQNTLVILTADHGEEFLEHNKVGHGNHLYDESIRIPLIFYIPGKNKKPSIVSQQVRSIDIMPTILELLNIPISSPIQGRSLMPLIKGIRAEEEYAFGGQGSFVRCSRWKLIFNRETTSYELYDLQQDSAEQHNLIDTEPEVAAQLKAKLHDHIKESMKYRFSSSKVIFSEEIKNRLKTLGYIVH
jgi:arylsulfatase A-like enzyme/MFS family permease